jgi:hypothetical protein
MAYTVARTVAVDVLRALGIDAENVARFRIEFDRDDAVALVTRSYIEHDALGRLVERLAEERWRLVQDE